MKRWRRLNRVLMIYNRSRLQNVDDSYYMEKSVKTIAIFGAFYYDRKVIITTEERETDE